MQTFWPLMHGIQICWDKGLKCIVCYTDFMHTIHLVQHANVSTHRYENEIAIIRKHVAKDWEFRLYHTLKKGSIRVDYLAKLRTYSPITIY